MGSQTLPGACGKRLCEHDSSKEDHREWLKGVLDLSGVPGRTHHPTGGKVAYCVSTRPGEKTVFPE